MIKRYSLPNGLGVILETDKQSYSAAVSVWVKAGSVLESKAENGLSHFMEHMAFKGTTTRDAKQLAKQMDALGGQVNAATSRTSTVYYARVLPDELKPCIELLSDIVLNPALDNESFQKEKQVIAEEIAMVEDSPEESVFDLINKALYKGSLSETILGEKDALLNYKRKALVDFRDKYYVANNALVVVAGNFDEEEIIKQIEGYFSSWKSGKEALYPKNAYLLEPKKLYVKKDTEQTHLCLGFKGVAEGDERIYAVSLLSTILGGGLSSRLFQSIREEHALAYQVYSSYTSYPYIGDFIVYAACKPENLHKVEAEIHKQIKNLKAKGITQEELDYAKIQVKTALVIANESLMHRMHDLGEQEMSLKKHVGLPEMLKKTDALTKEDIQAAAELLYMPCAKAIIGPTEE
ncbi:MAG: pitrilysin family protein [Eubacteriales bacterium]|nr:pitrilysin family protein [Eubacteriales bacterium]